jgi:hypothetical protein
VNFYGLFDFCTGGELAPLLWTSNICGVRWLSYKSAMPAWEFFGEVIYFLLTGLNTWELTLFKPACDYDWAFGEFTLLFVTEFFSTIFFIALLFEGDSVSPPF